MPFSNTTNNYDPVKYHNFSIGKFANIINHNNTNVKIFFKTYNNSMKTINYKTENIISKSSININNYSETCM